MTHSPTPTELLALRTANAALMSVDSSYDFASTIVFALGSAQLLQSPETAAELARLRAQVSELEATAELARTEALADAGNWLDEVGEKDAAYLVYTSDIPAARAMRPVPVEDPHDSPLHHKYKYGRDLPEVPRA